MTTWTSLEIAREQRLKARQQRRVGIRKDIGAKADVVESGLGGEPVITKPGKVPMNLLDEKASTIEEAERVLEAQRKGLTADEALAQIRAEQRLKTFAPTRAPEEEQKAMGLSERLMGVTGGEEAWEAARRQTLARQLGIPEEEQKAMGIEVPTTMWKEPPPPIDWEAYKRPEWATWESISLPYRFFFEKVAPTVGSLLMGKFAGTDLLQLVKEYDKGVKADPERIEELKQNISQQVEEKGLGRYAQQEWQTAMTEYEENVPDWQKMIAEAPAYFAPGGAASRLFWLPFTGPIGAAIKGLSRVTAPTIGRIAQRFARPIERKVVPSVKAWGELPKEIPVAKRPEVPIPEAATVMPRKAAPVKPEVTPDVIKIASSTPIKRTTMVGTIMKVTPENVRKVQGYLLAEETERLAGGNFRNIYAWQQGRWSYLEGKRGARQYSKADVDRVIQNLKLEEQAIPKAEAGIPEAAIPIAPVKPEVTGISPAIKGYDQMSRVELQSKLVRLNNIIEQYQKIKQPTLRQQAAYSVAVTNRPIIQNRLAVTPTAPITPEVAPPVGEVAEVLPRMAPKVAVQSLKEQATKVGFKITTEEDLAGNTFVIMTRTPKEQELRLGWLGKVGKGRELTTNEEKILGDVAAFSPIKPDRPLIIFRSVDDAQKFLETGDVSLITTRLESRAPPWTPEKLRATQKAIAEQEAARAQRVAALREQISQKEAEIAQIKAAEPKKSFWPVSTPETETEKRVALLTQEMKVLQRQAAVGSMEPGPALVKLPKKLPVPKSKEDIEQLKKLRKQYPEEFQVTVGGMKLGPKALPPLEPLTIMPTEEVISRTAIMRQIAEQLDIPIRRGHFRQRAAGVFKPTPEIIRIKFGEVRTVAHEVGHLLDKQYKLSGKISQKELAPLLAEYAKPKQKHAEALGEFLRFYVTEPEKAVSKAPKFTQTFDDFLKGQPELKNILDDARDKYVRWRKMPATSKLDSIVSREPVDASISLADREKKLYSMLWDDLYKIQDVVKSTGMKLAAIDDPYKLATLIRGISGKVSVFLERGTFGKDLTKVITKTGELKFKGKGLRQILEPVKGMQRDFGNYLVARRGLVLSARGIKTPLTANEYRAAYRELNSKYPQFAKNAKELYEYQKHLLDYAKESGLITDEGYSRLLVGSKSYVPFHRVFEELQARGFMGKRFVDPGMPIKRIKGSERDIIDPLESIVKNTYIIIDAADWNQVKVAMANLAGKNKIFGRMFEEIPTPMARVARVNAKELGIEVQGIGNQEVDDLVNIFRPRFFNEKENIESVLIRGKRKYFQLEPDLYRAMRSMDREQISWLINMASYPAKWLRAGAVLSPDFWLIKNPLRDTMSAHVYSNYGFVPIVDTVRGVFSMLRKDADYELWRMAGGVRSMLVSLDRQYLQKSLPEVMAGKTPLQYAKNPLEALQQFAEFTESGTRIGEFKRAIKAGASPWEAGYASREVTLDFAKVGAATRNINMITAFWNANMRAMDKLVRSFRDNPVRSTVKAVMGITLPSIGLYMANRDDPRWKEIPQWQKDLSWIIFTKKLPENWEQMTTEERASHINSLNIAETGIIRLPRPFELGILFGALPERVLEYLDTKDPKLFEDLARNAMESVNPGFIPTFALPWIENWTNHNFFRDQKLVPEGLSDEVPQLQYTTYTSETAKKMGEWLNMSPIKIENVFRGYSAGLGQYAINAIDAILKGTGIVPDIEEPTQALADKPILRSAIVRDPYGSGSQSTTRFYDTLEEYSKHESYLKAMVDKNNDAEFQKYKAKHPELFMQYDDKQGEVYSATARYLRRIAKELSDIRKIQREVHESPTLSAEEKRAKINKINLQMTEMARNTLDTLKWGPAGPSTQVEVVEIQQARERLARSKEILKEYDELDNKLIAYMNKQYPGFDRLLANYKEKSKGWDADMMAYARQRYPQIQEYMDLLEELKLRMRQKNTELETYLKEYRGMKGMELTHPERVLAR